ncbi:MAG: ATP-binding protein [Bdellovibrionales bacterium]
MSQVQQLDLEKSCAFYAQSVQNTLADLFDIKTVEDATIARSTGLGSEDEISFSILFTGQIYGEFLIGMSRQTAMNLLGLSSDSPGPDGYNTHRENIIETFQEVINIAAGRTLGQMKTHFPELSITPPRAIEGHVTLSNFEVYRKKLRHSAGEMTCYVYVDYMKLDVAELIQKQTVRQEELKRLNKAKSEFLMNMSHELRTPLNGMIGMLDILRTSKLSDLQQEQVSVICKSGDFLLSIINDILEFSKIESGKLQIEMRDFDLRKSLEAVTESLANEVFSKNLDFNIFVDPRVHGIYHGDETRIKQILVNLIGNAIKFTPTGHISVTVEHENQSVLFAVEDTGVGIPSAKLQSIFESFSQADVSDNRKYGGSGLGLTITKSIVDAMGGTLGVLSEEAKGSRFEIRLPLFQKEDDAGLPLSAVDFIHVVTRNKILTRTIGRYLELTEESSADSGLGDFVAQGTNARTVFVEMAEFLRGSESDQSRFMELQSQDRFYAVFLTKPEEISEMRRFEGLEGIYYINLPVPLARLRQVVTDRPTIQPQAKASAQTAEKAARSGLHLLLVEDNAINQRVALAMLDQLGHTVTVVDNGEKAVQAIAEREFDLVLMDCQMPVMNGYQATAAIRKQESTKGRHTLIVAMTANAFRETKEACFECGMDDFMTKPVKLVAFQEVLERALANAKAKMS